MGGRQSRQRRAASTTAPVDVPKEIPKVRRSQPILQRNAGCYCEELCAKTSVVFLVEVMSEALVAVTWPLGLPQATPLPLSHPPQRAV